MNSIVIDSVNARAFVESQIGYRLSDTQIAVIATGPDNALVCVACAEVPGDPVAVAQELQRVIQSRSTTECEFTFVSACGFDVQALTQSGMRCLPGVDDDVELAYLAEAPVSSSRADYMEQWAYTDTVPIPEITWSDGSYDTRARTVAEVVDRMAVITPDSVGQLLAALTGPIWLRDAVMIHAARRFDHFEPILRKAAGGSKDPRALAPIMFAALMSGREVAARALSERIDDDCDVTLVDLLRRTLDQGVAHRVATSLTDDDMLHTVLSREPQS